MALLIDWISVWRGGTPLVSCTAIPFLRTAAPSAGVIIAIIGVIMAAMSRQRMTGLALVAAGVSLWLLPDLLAEFFAPRC